MYLRSTGPSTPNPSSKSVALTAQDCAHGHDLTKGGRILGSPEIGHVRVVRTFKARVLKVRKADLRLKRQLGSYSEGEIDK